LCGFRELLLWVHVGCFIGCSFVINLSPGVSLRNKSKALKMKFNINTVENLNPCFDKKITMFGFIPEAAEQLSLFRLRFCENSFSGCLIGN
jgi:hypothetical protein